MGVVYRATNVALNRIYALKVLAPELADDDQFQERFRREMRVAASLHHPNVVGIHYAGEHDGLLFLVMDFIHGTDLRDLLQKTGALTPDRAVDLLAQLASALDAAHRKGLVHRDVKPGNVLITVRDGEEHAYLTDFGLAKRSDTVGGLTKKGGVVGTVDYMSPEQVTGGVTDARTDIYALGCVFFQMLTGKVPYERENSIATLFAHVHEPPPVLEGRLADSYPDFGAVLDEAMAKEAGDRYLSAGDFARAAAAALRGMRYTDAPTIVATGEARPLSATDPAALTREESQAEAWFSAEREAAREAEREATRSAEREAARDAEREAARRAASEAERTAAPEVAREPKPTLAPEVTRAAEPEPEPKPTLAPEVTRAAAPEPQRTVPPEVTQAEERDGTWGGELRGRAQHRARSADAHRHPATRRASGRPTRPKRTRCTGGRADADCRERDRGGGGGARCFERRRGCPSPGRGAQDGRRTPWPAERVSALPVAGAGTRGACRSRRRGCLALLRFEQQQVGVQLFHH